MQSKRIVCSIGYPCSSWLLRFKFPFNTPTKPLIRLYFKYKTVFIPKLKIILIFYISMINVNISNKRFMES